MTLVFEKESNLWLYKYGKQYFERKMKQGI